MQEVLMKLLKKDTNYSDVKKEVEFVDVRGVYNNNEIHFFEIKTDTPKNNIRQAIGQLLEYTFFPDTNKANKLYIIGDKKPNSEVAKYLNTLRDITSLNLYYKCLDMENNILSVDY